MIERALLIAIRPRFADMIFKGEKTVELRRVRPKIENGDLALVYVSSPIMALRGGFEVEKVISETPETLWTLIGNKAGISRSEFLAYFTGKKIAHALVIKRAWELPAPVRLGRIRSWTISSRPPQSYHYIRNIACPKSLKRLVKITVR